jgi:hypothetical protein
MKEEHRLLCDFVLGEIKTIWGYDYFIAPAISSLEAEELKQKYRDMIPEANWRDFSLIQRNIDNNLYTSISSFEEDGKGAGVDLVSILFSIIASYYYFPHPRCI